MVLAGRRAVIVALPLSGMGFLSPSRTAVANQDFVVTKVAEKRVRHLPPGPLYWRIETYPSLAEAKAAAGEMSLPVEVWGKIWLFTLGAAGGTTQGGHWVTEIGPTPVVSAPEYLLRINCGSGPPGAKTAVHTHPGAETFYVISGRLGQKTPHGLQYVETGGSMPGHGPGLPMEVFSSGATDLKVLVMFVVDATKPFSSPAQFD
ncbi:MAG: cupin domain-containing protein [Proteobacteria bacterium]|nr:cupin domain-containing protein [Pseudomonadota bacterium]